MGFKKKVKNLVREDLQTPEGACGICHLTLEKISKEGGVALAYEVPQGVLAQIIDHQGQVIGEGVDIVWAPSILKAQIKADLIPLENATNLEQILTSKQDLQNVARMSGYGRCVTPAATAISLIWADGGRVEVQRQGIGIEATLYDREDNLISDAVSAFCPVCAINISVAKNEYWREKIRDVLKDKPNTGKLKYERGVENIICWEKRRVNTQLRENNKIIGSNWGCCIAYATLRAEIDAGFGSEKWNQLFKNYCDHCPLKHCWTGKSMGAQGNLILKRMKEADVKEKVKMEDYITAQLFDGDRKIAQGTGTLCSLSATVNAFMRADAVEILKPTPAHGFPQKKD